MGRVSAAVSKADVERTQKYLKKKVESCKVTEPDRDQRISNLEEMIADERRITGNERINIVVEYAYLGQEPKPEKYVGRPRYIKGSRHGRTRLAKRSARRDDQPPPEEKMIVYDEEAAQLLHGAKYACLRKPGTAVKADPETTKDEPIDEDEHAKEHSRDSGCPVSPKREEGGEKKEEPTSSRGSVEKESRKRRSPEISNDDANATSGTSHFIVKGNTPLTVIRKLLERKRQIGGDLRLELIDANAKSNLDEKWCVADLANSRGWTRNKPLRVLYTITRFLETEELPVLEAEVAMPESQQESPPAGITVATPTTPTGPSPQQLHHHHMQQLHHQHQQRLQQLQYQQQQQHQQQQQQGNHPHPFSYVVIGEDGQQHVLPYPMMADHEGLLRLSAPGSMQAPPHPHHHPHHPHFMAPPTFMGGVMGQAPPPHGTTTAQQQQQMTSSIFPPGHVIVEHGNGSHIVAANISVESAISNPASVKKRQRMAPKLMRDRDEMMAQRGIERGATFMGKGSKTGLPFVLPGIISIRMPEGCNPQMLGDKNGENLPIEATTIDGATHSTTLRELPAVARKVAAAMAQQQQQQQTVVPIVLTVPLPSSMLTPEERVLETIDTVRTKAAVMHERIQAERRASDVSTSSSSTPVDEPPPCLAVEQPSEEGEETREASPPPRLDAPDTPDSPRSLTIDEMMEEDQRSASPPPPPPPALHGIPA